jgi:hypothetical protein
MLRQAQHDGLFELYAQQKGGSCAGAAFFDV